MNTRVITPLLSLATLALMLVAGGCSEVQKRTYEVNVRNESDRPVTVWLTKDGPFYEKNWKSPEDLAIETRNANEMIAGSVIRPGETQGIGPVNGKFVPRTNAILRVYLGEHGFSDLLSIPRGAPDRRDYELDARPATNNFRVVNRDGRTLIERTREPMSMSADAPASK
jgi:hypothetical protein